MVFFFSSESGFMCMEVYRKADSIMSLKLGKLSRNPEEACNQHLFFDTAIPSVIIVSSKMGHKERCPLVGKYALMINHLQNQYQCLPGKHHQDHLMFGCTGESAEFTLVQHDCVNSAMTTSGKN